MEGILIPFYVFGFFYLLANRSYKHKERMTMLRQGINPLEYNKQTSTASYLRKNSLKIGLIVMGIGFGGLLATLIIIGEPSATENSQELYFSLIATFGGIALILNYAIERKEEKEKKEKEEREKLQDLLNK
ncbi:MAG: DUF6249 domain-containing protein [Bacteroidales bacterium]